MREFDHVEPMGGGDLSAKAGINEYDRKTAVFALCLAHDHLADLVDRLGIGREPTIVDGRSLTWDQVLEHLRIARRRIGKGEQRQEPTPAPKEPPFTLDDKTRTIKLDRILSGSRPEAETGGVLLEFVKRHVDKGRDVVVDASQSEVLTAAWCRELGGLHVYTALANKDNSKRGRLVIHGARDVIVKTLAIAAPNVKFNFEQGEKS